MTETLNWVRYDDDRGELIVQLELGGAMCKLQRGMKMETVVNELRTLCNRLASGVHQRASEPNPTRANDEAMERMVRYQRKIDERGY